MPGASAIQQELSQRYGRGSWVYDATALLHACLKEVVPAVEPWPLGLPLERDPWFEAGPIDEVLLRELAAVLQVRRNTHA